MMTELSKTVRYTAQLLKIGGMPAFARQVARQVFSRDTLYCLEKRLDTDGTRVENELSFFLVRASKNDVNEFVTLAQRESPHSTHELLQRKWFYENGFTDCFIARTTDTFELAGMAWLVYPERIATAPAFSNRLPALKKDEILLENCYTPEKFRGKGIMPAIVFELQELARTKGFQRFVTYVRRSNEASLRVFEKLNFRKSGEARELKLLFMTRRNPA